MRLFNIILVIFFILTNGIKADTDIQVLENLKKGGNLIFIRHAYAPGGGDPDNFNINDCSTQRNLSDKGREQAKNIGIFFKNNQMGCRYLKAYVMFESIQACIPSRNTSTLQT